MNYGRSFFRNFTSLKSVEEEEEEEEEEEKMKDQPGSQCWCQSASLTMRTFHFPSSALYIKALSNRDMTSSAPVGARGRANSDVRGVSTCRRGDEPRFITISCQDSERTLGVL